MVATPGVRAMGAEALRRLLVMAESLGVVVRASLPELAPVYLAQPTQLLDLLGDEVVGLRIEQSTGCRGLVSHAVAISGDGRVLADVCAAPGACDAEPVAWRVALVHLLADAA